MFKRLNFVIRFIMESAQLIVDVDFLQNISEEMKSRNMASKIRSDTISNLMGEYLLKGWKMLNECCCTCEVSYLFCFIFVTDYSSSKAKWLQVLYSMQ